MGLFWLSGEARVSSQSRICSPPVPHRQQPPGIAPDVIDGAGSDTRRTLHDRLSELLIVAEVEPIKNGGRHSHISYHCAQTRDIAAVADEVGTSVGTIKKHYCSLVPTALAKPYFNIRPATPADIVVPMTGTAAGTAESKPGTRKKAR